MDHDAKRLTPYDSQSMAHKATLSVWGAEHHILEKVLTEKISEIEKEELSASITQNSIGSTMQLRREALQVLQKPQGADSENEITVRRMVIHELLLEHARKQDRLPWHRAHSFLLGAAGITCAVLGYNVCKYMCDC